jgi:hypothetical protein
VIPTPQGVVEVASPGIKAVWKLVNVQVPETVFLQNTGVSLLNVFALNAKAPPTTANTARLVSMIFALFITNGFESLIITYSIYGFRFPHLVPAFLARMG